MEREFYAYKLSRSNSFPVIRTASAKNRRYPWRRPCYHHMYLSIFNSYTMRKSKNRYYYHIFVSPEDAPGAVTLNVLWMEREFRCLQIVSCMCPSNYNRFWDRAIYLWFAFNAPVRGVNVGISPPRLDRRTDILPRHICSEVHVAYLGDWPTWAIGLAAAIASRGSLPVLVSLP